MPGPCKKRNKHVVVRILFSFRTGDDDEDDNFNKDKGNWRPNVVAPKDAPIPFKDNRTNLVALSSARKIPAARSETSL